VPESLEPNIEHGTTKKKKKKSHKSKNNDRSSPPVRSDEPESAQLREEDQSRPSKRKHESDPEHKKKKKKKKKEHDVNNESMNVTKVEPEQTASPQLEFPQEQPRTVQIEVEKATHAKPTMSGSVWDVDYPTNGELNSNGKPKKLRGSRPGGKNNLKVGFFTSDEVEKVENFKINFCNMNGIGNELFNQMVQHSEREGVEWPGPSDVSKHEFWTDIYSVLPDRDRRSLYRFARRHFQVTGQKAHEWTEEQDEELVELMKQYPSKYALIGRILGRSDDDVTQRWKNRLEHRDKMNHGNWNLDESLGFMKALQDFYAAHKELSPATAGNDIYEMDQKVIPWGSVSDSINNSRSRQQCADKWRKICKMAKIKRAQGDMAWVFDPEAAVKKTSQWKDRGVSIRSDERVGDDEGDDEGDDDDEGPVATSTPASDLKYGTAHQITNMMPKFETDTPIKPALSSSPDVDMEDEEEAEATYPSEPDTPATPAAVNRLSTPSGVSTPLSVGSIQKRDPNRMALIKEKIKAANKSDHSKKRRHSEVEAEPEPAPVPEAFSPTNEQAENEARLERKRRKKEKKEKKRQRALEKQEAEQARIEAETAAAAAETATTENAASEKPKKHKKHRKSHDNKALVDGIAAATLDKMKKKHRKSETGPSATVESPEASKKHKDKKKKKAHAIDKVTIKQEASI
jgi:flagellar biosynthesis GTPase FlhF